MKNLLIFILSLLTCYFLVHSLSDFALSFAEAWTGLIISALTFITYVAFKMKRV